MVVTRMPASQVRIQPAAPAADAVATKAVLRAAARLELSNKAVARVLGVSEATVSRMGAGAYPLKTGDKAFELAILFLRLFRSLDAMAGGVERTARVWLRSANSALGGVPA
jgi:hypothetical protein